MYENGFWSLVDGAHDAAGNDVLARPAALREQLINLPPEELQDFQEHFDAQILRSNRWDICAAAKIIDGCVTDDSFLYFRTWLISEGKATFEASLRNPDSLAGAAPFRLASLEGFAYVALALHEEKGGGGLTRNLPFIEPDPSGEDWDEKDLPTLLPRLWSAYQGIGD